MRILLLTSNQQRHLIFGSILRSKGNDVTIWAEEKGNALNDDVFSTEDKSLLDIHKNTLDKCISNEFIQELSVPINDYTLFSRGYFSNNDINLDIEKLAPDLIISYGCGIVGDSIIKRFKNKVLGSHQGLPQYFRGSGSNFFAFLEQKTSLMGISIHLLDSGIDTGKILLQLSTPPNYEDTYYTYSARLIRLTFESYTRVIENWNNEDIRTPLPLPTLGKLYQRKDFTPQILKKALSMQLCDNFYTWYHRSIAKTGKPKIITSI